MTEQEYLDATNLRVIRDTVAVLRHCVFMDDDPLKALLIDANRTLRHIEAGLEPRIKIRPPRDKRE